MASVSRRKDASRWPMMSSTFWAVLLLTALLVLYCGKWTPARIRSAVGCACVREKKGLAVECERAMSLFGQTDASTREEGRTEVGARLLPPPLHCNRHE